MNRSEIVKVRVTPEEKSNWEKQAAAKDMGVSELIRSRMNAHIVEPARVVYRDPAEMRLDEMKPGETYVWPPAVVKDEVQPAQVVPAFSQKISTTGNPAAKTHWNPATKPEDSPVEEKPVATSEPTGRGTCKHNRPGWVFCQKCDVG